MSEETKASKSTWQSPDAFLQLLVDLANDSEGPLPLPITLSVKGVLISGRLINGKTYFAEFSGQIRAAFEPYQKHFADIPEMEAWIKSFGDPDESERPSKELDANQFAERVRQTRFVHLQDATILQPGGRPVPSEGGLLWRGRLASVDGFSLGVLKNVPPDTQPDVWTAV
jgi:hypothetical protein